MTNEHDGTCNFYDGKSFAPLGLVDLKDDADNIRYFEGHLYVGYGNGGIATIDPGAKRLGSVDVSGHPEAFAVEARASDVCEPAWPPRGRSNRSHPHRKRFRR